MKGHSVYRLIAKITCILFSQMEIQKNSENKGFPELSTRGAGSFHDFRK